MGRKVPYGMNGCDVVGDLDGWCVRWIGGGGGRGVLRVACSTMRCDGECDNAAVIEDPMRMVRICVRINIINRMDQIIDCKASKIGKGAGGDPGDDPNGQGRM